MNETEVRNFAKTINAIFELISTRINAGIEELFRAIGYRFLVNKGYIKKLPFKDIYYTKLPFQNKLNKFYSY